MIKEVQFLDYFNSLMNCNIDRCKNISLELLDNGVDIIDIYTNLYQKSMYKVGKMWSQNKLSISDEHLSTQITSKLITLTAEHVIKKKPCGKSVLLTCIDKEFHDLGLRMVQNIFEFHGWNTIYLGACTPTNQIISACNKYNPDIIGLSYSLYLNFIRFQTLINDISEKFPNKQILIGGQGLSVESDLSNHNPTNIKRFTTLFQLSEYLDYNSD